MVVVGEVLVVEVWSHEIHTSHEFHLCGEILKLRRMKPENIKFTWSYAYVPLYMTVVLHLFCSRYKVVVTTQMYRRMQLIVINTYRWLYLETAEKKKQGFGTNPRFFFLGCF